jgi:glucose-6-phosphate dehydrogenase assembly protein OpcA
VSHEATHKAGSLDVEHFTCGEPIAVDVANIERELGALWKQASGAAAQGADMPVSRAARWNVVIPALGPEALARTKRMVDEMAVALPARTITLGLDGGQSGAIRATIESNVLSQPGGTRVVYSEEITIVGPPEAEAHFGALVRALQIPGLPTATFWMDHALPESLLARELAPLAGETGRLVLNTTCCLQPSHLFRLDRVAGRTGGVAIADIGWLRLGSLRSLFAGLFDPPVGGAPLARAQKVIVHHRARSDASALLLLAWLGVTLGWRAIRSAQTSDGGMRFDFQRGDAGVGPAVQGFLAPAEGPCGETGIYGIELLGPDGRFALRRTAIDQAMIESAVAPPRPVKLDPSSDAELAAAALGPRGRDPLFARCLAYARQLWSLDPSTDISRR